MGFFSDLSAALYDFKALSHELSKRSGARVLTTLSVIACIIGVVSGLWYAAAFGDLAQAIVSKGRFLLPEVVISNGTLSSPVDQPYVITSEDVNPEIFTDVAAVVRKRFHQGSQDEIEDTVGFYVQSNPQSFIFIVDTTGTYQEQIDLNDYSVSIVVDSKKARLESGGGSDVQEYSFAELAAYPNLAITPETINPAVVREKTKSALMGWLPLLFVVMSFLRYGLLSLIGSAVSFVVGIMMKRDWSYAQAYKLSVYALVPLMILDIIGVVWFAWPMGIPLIFYAFYVILPLLNLPKQEQKAQ